MKEANDFAYEIEHFTEKQLIVDPEDSSKLPGFLREKDMAAIYPKKRISDRSRYLWYDMGSRKNISNGGGYDG